MKEFHLEEEVTVIIQGRTAGFYKNYKYDDTESEELLRDNKHNKVYNTKHNNNSLIKLRNRRINRLIKSVCSISKYPDIFVSCIIPKKYNKDLYTEEILDYFDRLKNSLKYKFKNMWGVWKIEYKQSVGLHLHIIAKIDKYSSFDKFKDLRNVKYKIYDSFSKITRIKDDNIVNVKPFSPNHASYITAKKKTAYDMKCLYLLDGSRMWGEIHSKLIPRHEVYKCKLSEIEYIDFKRYIIRYLVNKGRDPNSYYDQFEKNCGRVSFISKSVLLEAVQYAISKRTK